MSAADAPPMLDGRAYLALKRELWEIVNAEIVNAWNASGSFDKHDVELIMRRLGDQDMYAVERERLPEVRRLLEGLLLRQGIPVRQESTELLERDAEQDAANRRTGLTTRLIELEHMRDMGMSPKDYDKWRRDMNKMESELDALPQSEADAIRQEARQAIADRD